MKIKTSPHGCEQLRLCVHVTFSYQCADIGSIRRLTASSSSSNAVEFGEDTSIKTMGEFY